jgi:mRNA interferase HicA
MTYHEAERKLRRLRCHELCRRSSGSHRKWVNPATGQATTVPDGGAKDLKLGTIRGIARQ